MLVITLLTFVWNVAAEKSLIENIGSTAIVLILMQVGYAAYIGACSLYERRKAGASVLRKQGSGGRQFRS